MHESLQEAMVSRKEVERLSHLLAALNHRQWVQWEGWVLRSPGLHVPASANDVWARIDVAALKLMLFGNAVEAISVVRGVVGDFAFEPDPDVVTDRKFTQFRSWVGYAVTKSDTERQKWLLKCRTPFFRLIPQDQVSDYVEARTDLTVVAEAAGLVLPDELPDFQPLPTWRQVGLRAWHAVGLHGAYKISETSWSLTCAGCHRSWSGL